MKRPSLIMFTLFTVAFLVFALSPVSLAQQRPEFKLGFKLLADRVPHAVGTPVEEEHYGPNGDSLQRTTTGLMVWRKADNWTAFTNGSLTWVNGPYGVMERGNDERFEWEAGQDLRPALTATPRPTVAVPTPTATLGRPGSGDPVPDQGLSITVGGEYFPHYGDTGYREHYQVRNTSNRTAVDVRVLDLTIEGEKLQEGGACSGPGGPVTLRPGQSDEGGNCSLDYVQQAMRMRYLTNKANTARSEGTPFVRGYFVTWRWQNADGSLSEQVLMNWYATHQS